MNVLRHASAFFSGAATAEGVSHDHDKFPNGTQRFGEKPDEYRRYCGFVTERLGMSRADCQVNFGRKGFGVRFSFGAKTGASVDVFCARFHVWASCQNKGIYTGTYRLHRTPDIDD